MEGSSDGRKRRKEYHGPKQSKRIIDQEATSDKWKSIRGVNFSSSSSSSSSSDESNFQQNSSNANVVSGHLAITSETAGMRAVISSCLYASN